jgi:hypothetical protein
MCAPFNFICLDIQPTIFSRIDHHDLARKTFQDMNTKNLDYPEALWDARHNFEHAHGSLSSLAEAINKITQAGAQPETRRARVSAFSSSFGNISTAF